MFLFSCNATCKKAQQGLKAGEQAPFIVYIHYKDLFGAEHLCKLYLLQAGFNEINIEKRKQLNPAQAIDLAEHDKEVAEALKHGFCLRLFESH